MFTQPQYFNTLAMMPNTMFLIIPPLFVAGIRANSTTSIDGCNPELPTFFGTGSLSKEIIPLYRSNNEMSLSNQKPPTIKWERFVSQRSGNAFTSGQPAAKTPGNALSIGPYNMGKRGTFNLLDPKMIQTALTERTIHGSQIPYLKNYSRCTQSHPSAIPGGRELEKVLRERLNVTNVKNESAIRFWNFFDCKANAFPNAFTSFRLVPRSTSHRKLKQLMNQKSADASVDVLAPLAPALRAMVTAMTSTNVDDQKKNDNFVVTYFGIGIGRATQRKNEKDKDSVLPSDDVSSELALRSIPPLGEDGGTDDGKEGRSAVVVSSFGVVNRLSLSIYRHTREGTLKKQFSSHTV